VDAIGTPLHDIATRDDLESLLRSFYGRAFADPLLRHVFVDVVHMDLESHLPVIADFWQKVLFNTGPYSGRTMDVHRRIHRRVPLTDVHFDRWLALWREAVNDTFDGPVADRAVAHATRMAAVFSRELNQKHAVGRTLPVAPFTLPPG
jgi:hemoglobin